MISAPTGFRRSRHQMLRHLVHRAARQHTLKSRSGWQTWDNALDGGLAVGTRKLERSSILLTRWCRIMPQIRPPPATRAAPTTCTWSGRKIDDRQQREVVVISPFVQLEAAPRKPEIRVECTAASLPESILDAAVIARLWQAPQELARAIVLGDRAAHRGLHGATALGLLRQHRPRGAILPKVFERQQVAVDAMRGSRAGGDDWRIFLAEQPRPEQVHHRLIRACSHHGDALPRPEPVGDDDCQGTDEYGRTKSSH